MRSATLNGGLANFGYLVVGIFVASWAISYLIYRWQGLDRPLAERAVGGMMAATMPTAPVVSMSASPAGSAGEPDSEPRPGALLAAATERAAAGTEVDGAAAALPRQLHARAERRDALQRLVDLRVRRPRRATCADALIEGARLLAGAADGILPWRGRPEILKRGLIARVPPIDFRRGSTNERLARARSLHHRHRLSRRRQNHADPPCARQCAGPPPRRHRQRIRRRRHRRRNPQRLRQRRLPGGEHRRTRQWLPVLHGRRRIRAGARCHSGARTASSTS